MIEFCTTDRIRRVFDRIETNSPAVSEVAIASPFIDADGAALLRRAVRAASRRRFVIRILTRPETNAFVAANPGLLAHSLPNLHAKLYCVLGRHPGDHELIVTSANLTQAGLARNVEIGVRLTGSRPEYARLIERAAGWIRARIDESRLQTLHS